MTMTRVVLVQFGFLLALERLAHACPFCGGKGASGLLENLLLVAVFWFGARALMRAAKERSPRPQHPAQPESDQGTQEAEAE